MADTEAPAGTKRARSESRSDARNGEAADSPSSVARTRACRGHNREELLPYRSGEAPGLRWLTEQQNGRSAVARPVPGDRGFGGDHLQAAARSSPVEQAIRTDRNVTNLAPPFRAPGQRPLSMTPSHLDRRSRVEASTFRAERAAIEARMSARSIESSWGSLICEVIIVRAIGRATDCSPEARGRNRARCHRVRGNTWPCPLIPLCSSRTHATLWQATFLGSIPKLRGSRQ